MVLVIGFSVYLIYQQNQKIEIQNIENQQHGVTIESLEKEIKKNHDNYQQNIEVKDSKIKELENLLVIKKQERENNIYPKNTQFVMIAFDGAPKQRHLDFAQELKKENISLFFTYFLSGVYLLPSDQKNLYALSWMPTGSSDIGFGGSQKTVNARIKNINRALAEGHEIESHLNGHFDASSWTKEQWKEEIDLFNNILDNTLSEKIKRDVSLNIRSKDIIGMRTPLLGKNMALYETLKEMGYSYDTSAVSKIGNIPEKDDFGIWQFPLVSLKLGEKNTLSMDYNHYFTQTNAKNLYKKGTQEWNTAKKEVFDAYMDYFEKEYNGNRSPINIGHHSALWNDAAYEEALKDFARSVCGKKQVACINYKTLVKNLEQKEI